MAILNTPGPPQVNIGAISIDESSAKFIVPPTPSIWGEVIVRNHYEGDKHIYMAGITSPSGFQGSSAAFFQLTGPTMLWIADWTASMDGRQPQIPDPESVSSNWVLMDGHFQLNEMQVALDGETPHYRISGTYIYGNKTPSANMVGDAVFPLPPYLQDSFPFGRLMPTDRLQPGIIYNVQDRRRR